MGLTWREKRRRREIRQIKVREMLLRGISHQNTMANALGVSQMQISRDIQDVYHKWGTQDIEEACTKLRKRIKQFEFAASASWESYVRSRQDSEEVTTVTHNEECPKCKGKNDEVDNCEHCDKTGKVQVETQTRRIKGQAGDAAFLNQYQSAIRECAKLEGHYVDVSPVRKLLFSGEMEHTHTAKIENKYSNAPPELLIAAKNIFEQLEKSMNTEESNQNAITVDVNPVKIHDGETE